MYKDGNEAKIVKIVFLKTKDNIKMRICVFRGTIQHRNFGCCTKLNYGRIEI